MCHCVCVCVSGNRCRYTAGKGIKTCAQKLLIHLLRIPETIRQVLAYFNGDGFVFSEAYQMFAGFKWFKYF